MPGEIVTSGFIEVVRIKKSPCSKSTGIFIMALVFGVMRNLPKFKFGLKDKAIQPFLWLIVFNRCIFCA